MPRRARRPPLITAATSLERRLRLVAGRPTLGDRGGEGAPASGRQLAAALAATGGDDGATGAGTHPQPEAVRLRAAAVVRLEGALTHGQAPKSAGFRCR